MDGRHDQFRKHVQFLLLLVGGAGRVPAVGRAGRLQVFHKSCAESRFHPKGVLSVLAKSWALQGCCKPLSSIWPQNCRFLGAKAATAMLARQGGREWGGRIMSPLLRDSHANVA